MRVYDPLGAIMVFVRIRQAVRSGREATIVLEDGEQLHGHIVKSGRFVKVRTRTGPAWIRRREIAEVRN